MDSTKEDMLFAQDLALLAIIIGIVVMVVWGIKNITKKRRKEREEYHKHFIDAQMALNDLMAFQADHLVKLAKEKEEKKTAEPTGYHLYKAVRSKDAPDITLTNVVEVTIIAGNRKEAMTLLRQVKDLVDDGWWTLVEIETAEIVDVKYQGGVL